MGMTYSTLGGEGKFVNILVGNSEGERPLGR